MNNEKAYNMSFAKVYEMLVAKAERKGRIKPEVDIVTCWLTGYDEVGLQAQIEDGVDMRTFFSEAPHYNPNADKISGVICGVRVETIDEPLMKRIRQLDKLVDELSKGKALDKVLRE